MNTSIVIPTFKSKFEGGYSWEYALAFEIGASVMINPANFKKAVLAVSLAELRNSVRDFVETNSIQWGKVFDNLPQWMEEETLVATGESILSYPHLGEDIGEFISFKMMQMREQFGGFGDPRMTHLKAWKEYHPSIFTDSYMALKPEEVKVVRRVQADLLIPTFYLAPEEREERITKLVTFCEDAGIWLFPLPPEEEEVVLDISITIGSSPAMGKWLHTLSSWGIKLWGARIQGAEAYPMSLNWMCDTEGTYLEVPALEGTIHDKFTVTNLNNWWLDFLGSQLDKLTPHAVGELILLLAPESSTDVVNGSKLLTCQFGTAQVGFDFYQNKVFARRMRHAFGQFFAGGQMVPARVTLFWLALLAATPSRFGEINGVMNDIPNMWQREVNYGLPWEENHPTAVIRNNGGLPLNWKGHSSYPLGMKVFNEKFDSSLARKCLGLPQFRDSIYVDKNAMKVVAGNGAGKAGLTAIQRPKEVDAWLKTIADGGELLPILKEAFPSEMDYFNVISRLLKGEDPRSILVEEFSFFVTANDGAKITKLLNRVQQGGSYNECDIVIVFLGETYERGAGYLKVVGTPTAIPPSLATKDEEDDFLKGLMTK